jgi:hypothetical protein
MLPFFLFVSVQLADRFFYPVLVKNNMKNIEIKAKYLEGTNLASGSSIICFIRTDVSRLFSALHDVASSESIVCSISGPPGIGKSLAIFMCSLLDSHIVTWGQLMFSLMVGLSVEEF